MTKFYFLHEKRLLFVGESGLFITIPCFCFNTHRSFIRTNQEEKNILF